LENFTFCIYYVNTFFEWMAKMKGISLHNLLYLHSSDEHWPKAEFVQQAVALLPLGQSLLLTKSSRVMNGF